MSRKDIFSGMASGISILGLYFNATAKDSGQEKAFALYEKVGESFGAGNAQALKEKFGGRTPTARELREFLSTMYKGYGFEFSIRAGKNKVTNKIMKCPFYDGLMMAGLDHETIHKMCQNASKGEERALNIVFPEFSISAEPKLSPEGFCLERYTIKKA